MAKTHVEAWAEITAKHKRAQKHIYDLNVVLDSFTSSNPYGIGEETDIESGDITYYCSRVTDIPVDIALIFGDAVHNLRSTLDYLAWKMVERAGGTLDTHTSFPIFDDAKGYASLMPGRVKGLGDLAIKALNRLQPYKGGNDRLWQLHQLDIRDKHRLLLAIDHSSFGHMILNSQKNKLIDEVGGNPIPDEKSIDSVLKMNDVPFPLNVGYKLMTIPAAYANVNVGFAVDVAINEIGVAEGHPLPMIMSMLSDEVSLVLNTLAPFV
jgi:hypothetical protein